MKNRLAIVLGRNYTSRLGMIRAAGVAGCDVAVIQTDKLEKRPKHPIDCYSKYITRGYFKANEPNTELIISVLLKNFKGEVSKPILLPTDDYTASIIDLNIDELKNYFLFPSINLERGKVVYYMDKAVQKEMALEAGFDVATGWTATWKDGKYQIPAGIQFPCFIKPEISFKGASKYVMQKCNTEKQLEAALSKMPGREDYPILIEKYIGIEKEYDVPGISLPGCIYLPGIIEKGEIFLGVTATGRMLHMADFPDIENKLTMFLEKLHFQGLIDIELFESEGRIYFNELNMRFGASGFAMTGSGVNMPEMLIHSLLSESVDTSTSIVQSNAFASEKVLLQKVGAGQMKIAEYNRIVREADLRFVKDDSDPQPYVALEKSKRLVIIKRLIKNIIGRN